MSEKCISAASCGVFYPAHNKTTIRKLPMHEENCIADIIRNTRQEILFAIKERLLEMAKINDEPFPLKGIAVGDERHNRRVSLDYYEINNVYVDDNNILCGDLVCRHGAFFGDVFFGKSIEYLGIE